jgi:hypothetical protein
MRKKRRQIWWLEGGISALQAIIDDAYDTPTEDDLPAIDVVTVAKFRAELQAELDEL